MNRVVNYVVNYAFAILTAALLVFLFPNFNWTWLAPVALTPILIACARESSWKQRFLFGWASGFAFWFGICNWIQFVLEVHGGMGRWGGWGTFVLFAAIKGLHMAIFAALAGVLLRSAWAIPIVAALWAGLERTHGLAGFTWLDLGNAGIDMPLLMRLAPFTGVYGLSFVFAMIACTIAVVLLRKSLQNLAWLFVPIFLFLLPAAPVAEQGKEHALIVQPNLDTEMQWTTASLAVVERQLATFSRSQPAPLIIWPEVPAPFYPGEPEFRAYVESIARENHAYLLFGGVAYNSAQAPLNSAFLFDPSGSMIARYDKIKLVPFGEYVPDIFGWVNRITKEAGDFAPGEKIVEFSIAGHRAGAFICYESAFPDLVRQFAAGGAEVLLNLSNDGYFGHSAAREQHLKLVRMRAAENRRWILRATNDGITATVDPAGRVVFRGEPYQLFSADVPYQNVTETTVYTRHGDVFAWGCLIAGLLWPLMNVNKREWKK